MRYGFTGWAGLGVAFALLSCGSDSAVRSETTLVEPDWTITFLAPDHGSTVSSPVEYLLALSGPGVTRGEPLPFDIGFFANDVLIHRTRDPAGLLELPLDTRSLEVRGIDEKGEEVEKVLGDQIRIQVEE